METAANSVQGVRRRLLKRSFLPSGEPPAHQNEEGSYSICSNEGHQSRKESLLASQSEILRTMRKFWMINDNVIQTY